MWLLWLFGNKECSATTATATVSSTNSVLRWTGAWQFEKEWFGQQHPWLPGFLLRKALQSTLILQPDAYHQVDVHGKPLKQARPLQLLAASAVRAELERIEGKRKVPFQLELRDDGYVYYIEQGLGEYRLLPVENGGGGGQDEL